MFEDGVLRAPVEEVRRSYLASFTFLTEFLNRDDALSTTLKIAVLAPIPNAKVITTMAVKPGCFHNPRAP
jgi:hypothetical protein